MTRRQKILNLLTGYLEDISTVNGYLTDAGANVSHWKTQIIPNAGDEMINLKDMENTHDNGHIETLNITVELACRTSTNYTTITNMIQDVQKCFEDNLAALGTAISENGARWFAGNETIELTKEKDAEIARAVIEMQLQHKFDEKWLLDENSY